jgi:hypothetical protein
MRRRRLPRLPKAFPAKGAISTPTTDYSLLLVQLFLLVMVFILTIFVLWKQPIED